MARRPPATLAPVAEHMLSSVARHRLLTTAQLRILHAPDVSRQWTSVQLAGLTRERLVGWSYHRGKAKMWWLTRAGADEAGEGARPMTAAAARSRIHQHTLDTNQVGVALTRHAREHGDEFGAGSWRNEVGYRYKDGHITERYGLLVVDALCQYERHDHGTTRFADWFVELDRGTESIQRLGAKLRAYITLHEYKPKGETRPAWETHHVRFPDVLIVLAGRRSRERLEARRESLVTYCRRDPVLAGERRVSFRVCLLEDLIDRGPYAPICLDPVATDPGADGNGQLRFEERWTDFFGRAPARA